MEPIRFSYDVPVGQAAAFALFVEEFSTWWPGGDAVTPSGFDDVTLVPRRGGDVAWSGFGRSLPWGRVTTFDVGERVGWSCWWMGETNDPSHVEVTFAENDWGCRVVFTHGGWNPRNEAWRERYGHWPRVLAHYVLHTRRVGVDPVVGDGVRGVA